MSGLTSSTTHKTEAIRPSHNLQIRHRGRNTNASNMRLLPTASHLVLLVNLTIFILPLFFLVRYSHATENQQPIGVDMSGPLNVFKKPLQLFSKAPMTGYYRDGYCRTGAGDFGNHAVAGVVSEEFLDFTARQGNDLRMAGLSGGCKWCLCTSRWFEAYQAYKDGRIGIEAVPKVNLDATEDSALNKVDLDTFKQFEAKSDSNGIH